MNFVDSELLVSVSRGFGVGINDEQLENFRLYAELLCVWNEKINLTAITSPEGIALLHFADSLTLLSCGSFKAGFPSVPLCIMRPDMKFTMMDSLNKRLVFLEQVKDRLGLNFEIVHGRAEELGKKPEYREQFDFATARAVAQLNVLSEYCLPFVKPGGSFLAMKGPSGRDETEAAEKAIGLLGGKLSEIKEFSLGENTRQVVMIDKISPTPERYPRQSGKIKKVPL